jgi:hypothetical protein
MKKLLIWIVTLSIGCALVGGASGSSRGSRSVDPQWA